MGKDFLLIMPFLVLLSFSSCEEEDSVTSKTENTINGHEYVDLGLPSGTLWATCNVGATKPEEYGDYFAWGETSPKEGKMYEWKSYKWNVDLDLTKYCFGTSYKGTIDSYRGIIDNLSTLLPEDDAATANWGSDWRMPTIAQLHELIQCEYSWIDENGMIGMKFIGYNGNTIFLPAAGYYSGSGALNSKGSIGYYWSSSLNSLYDLYAHSQHVSKAGAFWDAEGNSRSFGYSVRAVRTNK